MCGIVAYIGADNVLPILQQGLKRLEYRGYDSVGVATISQKGLHVVKTPGRVDRLAALLTQIPEANVGIGHSRWATHGPATKENAHPHVGGDGELVLVHNGVIENHDEIRDRLKAEGYQFRSDTDTEVVAHLIHFHTRKTFKDQNGIRTSERLEQRLAGIREALRQLDGAYALAILFQDQPHTLLAVRQGSPLVLGAAHDGYLVGSDIHSIGHHAKMTTRLDNGDIAILRGDSIKVLQDGLRSMPRKVTWKEYEDESLTVSTSARFEHFTLNEIHEQTTTLKNATRAYREDCHSLCDGPLASTPSRILIAACGTSWNAGLFAKHAIESLANIPVDLEFASEFRYRSPAIQPGTAMIAVSQSGETADTLGALRAFRSTGQPTIAFCNVAHSTLVEETDGALLLRAGSEQGVAATKSYTAQCAAFVSLALELARRGDTANGQGDLIRLDLEDLPLHVKNVLKLSDEIQIVANALAESKRFLFVGRGFDHATAMEGALKLKETSYVSAEAYAAGELKHGPLALVDEETPTIAIATPCRAYDKMLSNLQEIRARAGTVIAIGARGDTRLDQVADVVLHVPTIEDTVQPILNIIPLQLLAYYIAVQRGCDVDRPRNLAKSVTVE